VTSLGGYNLERVLARNLFWPSQMLHNVTLPETCGDLAAKIFRVFASVPGQDVSPWQGNASDPGVCKLAKGLTVKL
jgi:hypothetical protein